jgi:outer membrane protein OmpA-like peptidoglycan-associated protein/ABC-type amino acid transport substrate-binding protein
MNGARLRSVLAGVIALVLAGGAVAAGVRLYRLKRAPRPTRAEDKRPRRPPHRIIVGVTDSATAYPGLLANDGATPGVASKMRAAGLDVEIRPIRGFRERMAAFDAGEVDLMLGTIDHLASVAPSLVAHGTPPRVPLLAGYSRGNLGIVATSKVRGLEGLKGARVATTRNSPAHYFLSAVLRRSSLSVEDRERLLANLQFVSRTSSALDGLRHGEFDAAALPAPQLGAATQGGGRVHLLVSTAAATRLMPEVLFARESFVDERAADLARFVQVWLDGVDAALRDPARAAQVAARALQLPVEETRAALAGVALAPFSEQRRFFGLQGGTSEFAAGFAEASEFLQREHVIDAPVAAGPVPWLKGLEALAPAHAGDPPPVEAPVRARSGAPAMLTRVLDLHYPMGEAELEPEARRRIDELAPLLRELGGAPVRVECNTDATAHVPTYKITRLRAQAVVDYLVTHHGFAKSRFLAVGNGTDKPVASDETPEGRQRNRRTEVILLSE